MREQRQQQRWTLPRRVPAAWSSSSPDRARPAPLPSQVGHSDFVTALAYLPPGAAPAFPRGAIVSGSRDTTVVLWDPETYVPLETLRGHQYQVTGVAVTPAGDVVSSSMDKTLRAWRAGECVAVMEGHEAAVLCLVVLPGGALASGSGDCTIRVWTDYMCTHTIAAHADSVR